MYLATHLPPEAALRGKQRNKTLYFSYQNFLDLIIWETDSNRKKTSNTIMTTQQLKNAMIWLNPSKSRLEYSSCGPTLSLWSEGRFSTALTLRQQGRVLSAPQYRVQFLFLECSSRKSTQLLSLWTRRGVWWLIGTRDFPRQSEMFCWMEKLRSFWGICSHHLMET